jgi:hypothetical protein
MAETKNYDQILKELINKNNKKQKEKDETTEEFLQLKEFYREGSTDLKTNQERLREKVQDLSKQIKSDEELIEEAKQLYAQQEIKTEETKPETKQKPKTLYQRYRKHIREKLRIEDGKAITLASKMKKDNIDPTQMSDEELKKYYEKDKKEKEQKEQGEMVAKKTINTLIDRTIKDQIKKEEASKEYNDDLLKIIKEQKQEEKKKEFISQNIKTTLGIDAEMNKEKTDTNKMSFEELKQYYAKQKKSKKEREVKIPEVKEREVKIPETTNDLSAMEKKELNTMEQDIADNTTLEITNNLINGIKPGMNKNQEQRLLELNRNQMELQIKQKAREMGGKPNLLLDKTIKAYDHLFDFLNLEGVSNGVALLLAGASSIRPKSKITGEEDVSNVALGTALLYKGYDNLAGFFSSSEEKEKVEVELDDFTGRTQNYNDYGMKFDPDFPDDEGYQDLNIDNKPKSKSNADMKDIKDKIDIGVGVAAIAAAGSYALSGDKKTTTDITTRKVDSVIDKKISDKDKDKKDAKIPDKRKQFYPRVIYPDDEILEPTARKVLQSQYNLAKFDWINPNNVGGNNENNDNPFYKMNDEEIARRYLFWKEQAQEKENEYLKQLPPVISNKIKAQFPRSFLSSSERQPTRTDWLTKNPWQFPSYNSPYNDMTRVDGTNAFINNSVLYGIVP